MILSEGVAAAQAIPGGCCHPRTENDQFVRRRGSMRKALLRLWGEEEGQDLTEYALLLVLLSLAAIASLSSLASAINGVFSQAVTNLT